MLTLNRYTLATLLAALPLVTAQDAPGPTGPPPGAPEGASDKQGDEGMDKYAEWYSNDYDCGKSLPNRIRYEADPDKSSIACRSSTE